MKLSDAELIEQLSILEARESFWAYRLLINKKIKLGWWQREVAEELQDFYEELIQGLKPMLVIEAPPQHGKSIQIIEFITWLIGKHPEFRTIYTSFSDRLGVRANLRIQRIMDSDIYAKIFPEAVEW